MIRTFRPALAATEILESQLKLVGKLQTGISTELFDAHEQSMMYGEHTWGGSFAFIGLHLMYGKTFDDMMAKD